MERRKTINDALIIGVFLSIFSFLIVFSVPYPSQKQYLYYEPSNLQIEVLESKNEENILLICNIESNQLTVGGRLLYKDKYYVITNEENEKTDLKLDNINEYYNWSITAKSQ